MKTIGLIGGLSWESSADYYRQINQQVKARLGGQHSAQILLYSFDFAQIEALQRQHDWPQATRLMIDAAQRLEQSGADVLLICSNTMHKMADAVQASITIPLLHIADATAEHIRRQGLHRVGLLGTRYTLEQEFYKGRLHHAHGLQVLIPPAEDIDIINAVIYDELCQGRIEPASRQRYRQIMAALAAQGAEGIILGCTEITLLVAAADSPVPLFDTTTIHATAAVDYSVGDIVG